MSTIPPISQSRLVTPAAIARLILSVWWMRTKLSYRKCSCAFSKLHPHQKSWFVTDPNAGPKQDRNLNSQFGRENSLFFAIWMKNKRSPFGEANSVRKKDSRAIIAADVRRFGHVINKDGVLGTHSRTLDRHSGRLRSSGG